MAHNNDLVASSLDCRVSFAFCLTCADIVRETLVNRYADQATQFIKNNTADPFFLYLAMDNTHSPVFSPPNFTSPRGPYGAATEALDWVVGQVRKKRSFLKQYPNLRCSVDTCVRQSHRSNKSVAVGCLAFAHYLGHGHSKGAEPR